MSTSHQAPMCLTKSGWFLLTLGALLAGHAECDTTGGMSSRKVAAAGYTGPSKQNNRHPKAPPSPQPDSIPPGSTHFNLDLEDGYWDVLIENDATVSEVEELFDSIYEEAGLHVPPDAAKETAGQWNMLKNAQDSERTAWWFEISGAKVLFETYIAPLVKSAGDHPYRTLEVDSFEGASAMWVAENLLQHPDSILICLDTWEGSREFGKARTPALSAVMSDVEGRFHRNMARAPNGERVTAVKGDSMLSLSKLVAAGATPTFDVIYVDAGHTMANALTDCLLSFRLLKVGGLLMVDDMLYPGVSRAMSAFVEALEADNCIEVLNNKKVLVARKTADDPWATPTSDVTKGLNPFPSLFPRRTPTGGDAASVL